ncbi:MAG: hypothetical protein C0498_05975 [Anaerolinea sp.]|nr:hypothetical protein [Anaerolinea sp.]
MRGNRGSGTGPEVRLRSALHRDGLRFRTGLPVLAGDVRVRPDATFTRARLAVFVDGCYWHRCPEHGTRPSANAAYWGPKLDRNVDRDLRVDAALAGEGWAAVRLWEHEIQADLAECVGRVRAALRVRPDRSSLLRTPRTRDRPP